MHKVVLVKCAVACRQYGYVHAVHHVRSRNIGHNGRDFLYPTAHSIGLI